MVRIPVRETRSLLLAAAGALTLATAAHAASPDVKFIVEATPAKVTYSTAQQSTQSALQVLVRNDSNNTLNRVRVEISASCVDGATACPSPAVTLVRTIGLDCSSTNGIACTIGQLRGNGGERRFTLVFDAPTAGGQLRYDSAVYYSEGSGDASGAAHDDVTFDTDSVELGGSNTLEVRSFVLPDRAKTFFTGVDGLPKAAALGNDLWTTVVTVPKVAQVQVLENEFSRDGVLCPPQYKRCVQSTIDIPKIGTALPEPETFGTDPLYIVLRRHPETLNTNAKIQDAKVYYEPGYVDAAGMFQSLLPAGEQPYLVPLCSVMSLDHPANKSKRCLDGAPFEYKGSVPAALKGVWEFRLKARENGRTYF